MITWHAQEIQKYGAIFQLTIEPDANMDIMPQDMLSNLALACKTINEFGVPILLRYGHEMNGDWTSYGMKPSVYIQGFQRMAVEIRKLTNLTGI